MTFFHKHGVAINTLAVGVFMTLAFVAMLWQPISVDENDFFLAAAHWQNWRQAIPHPQGQVHAMQFAFALLGQTTTAARLPQFLANLVTLALLVWLVRLCFGDRAPARVISRAQMIAVWLFGLFPLTIQNLALIDIDNGLLTAATTLMLCVWLWARRKNPITQVVSLGMSFALALWFKLPTPPMVIAAIAGHELLRRKWREFFNTIFAGALGAALFVATISLYGVFTGFGLKEAFAAFLSRSGQEGSIVSRIPTIFLQSNGVFAFWFGLGLMALLALACLTLILKKTNGADKPELAMMMFLLIMFAFYGAMIVPAWGYPRYHTPLVPPAFAIIAFVVAQRSDALPSKFYLWGALAALLTAGCVFVFVGDPLFGIYRATFETDDLRQRIFISLQSVTQQSIPIILACAGFLVLAIRARLSKLSALMLALLSVGLGMYLATNAIQLTATYSTRYRYTYRYADREQALALVKQAIPPNGFLLADRDIIWYANRPGELDYPYLLPGAMLPKLNATHVDGIVWTEKEFLKLGIRSDAAAMQTLEGCFNKHDFGIYSVLLRKPNACPELP